MYELQGVINCLLLAAVLTTGLGVPIKRQSSNNCLFQYVTQPSNVSFDTCNPFTPDENSLTLECSILVGDSRAGELTISWIFYSGSVTETLSSTIAVTSPGTVISSNITVPRTRTGRYYCQPNSTQAGLLQSSSQTTILSQAVYFHTSTSCKGMILSTEQSKCILQDDPLSNTAEPSSGITTQVDPETTTEPLETENGSTTEKGEPLTSHSMTPPDSSQPVSPGVYSVAIIGLALLIAAIVVCTVPYCHHRRTNRSRVPHSQGNGSRIVTDWHAVRTAQTSPESHRYGTLTRNNSLPPAPSTLPPELTITNRESRLTSSGYVDANPLLCGAPYHEYNSIWFQRDNQSNEQTSQNLLSSDTNAEHLYANYRPPHSKIQVEPILEEDEASKATSTHQGEPKTETPSDHNSVVYSVVGNKAPIYQRLVPETRDYISLYNTVSKT